MKNLCIIKICYFFKLQCLIKSNFLKLSHSIKLTRSSFLPDDKLITIFIKDRVRTKDFNI